MITEWWMTTHKSTDINWSSSSEQLLYNSCVAKHWSHKECCAPCVRRLCSQRDQTLQMNTNPSLETSLVVTGCKAHHNLQCNTSVLLDHTVCSSGKLAARSTHVAACWWFSHVIILYALGEWWSMYVGSLSSASCILGCLQRISMYTDNFCWCSRLQSWFAIQHKTLMLSFHSLTCVELISTQPPRSVRTFWTHPCREASKRSWKDHNDR